MTTQPRRDWRSLLDDLNPGDAIQVDCGSTMAVGSFVQLRTAPCGVWLLEVKTRRNTQEIPVREIESMTRYDQ